MRLWDEDGVLCRLRRTFLDDDGDTLVVIQVTSAAATITALKNGEVPLITLEGQVDHGRGRRLRLCELSDVDWMRVLSTCDK